MVLWCAVGRWGARFETASGWDGVRVFESGTSVFGARFFAPCFGDGDGYGVGDGDGYGALPFCATALLRNAFARSSMILRASARVHLCQRTVAEIRASSERSEEFAAHPCVPGQSCSRKPSGMTSRRRTPTTASTQAPETGPSHIAAISTSSMLIGTRSPDGLFAAAQSQRSETARTADRPSMRCRRMRLW